MNLDGLPYELATMTLDDVPTVSDIERVVFTLPWSSIAFSHEVRDNHSASYLVLRYAPWREAVDKVALPRGMRKLLRQDDHDPSVLGYGGYWMILDEAHISTIALRQEWRGRGLGELLMVSLIEGALRDGAEFVTLEVRVSNVRAQNLYLKYGFEVTGRRKRYYSDNNEDAYVMSTAAIPLPAYRARVAELAKALRARLLAASHGPPITLPPR